MRITHKMPQFKGLSSGAGGTPSAPLEYLDMNMGSPASSTRPTTREPAGKTMKAYVVRQTHIRGRMTDGEER